MIFLFNWVIFWFHVNLPGCIPGFLGQTTVDGWNPAPVDMIDIPLFTCF